MVTGLEDESSPSKLVSSDPQYAFVGGLYLAAFLTPATTLLVSTVVSSAALLYIGFLATWVVSTIVGGWTIARVDDLALRIGNRDRYWLLTVIPFAVFVGTFVALSLGSWLPSTAVPLAMITMITGVLFGFPFVLMSQNRHAAAVSADAVEYGQWEARWPSRWRRLSTGALILSMASVTVAVVAQLAFDADWGTYFYLFAFLWTPLASTSNPRTFRVTDAGLVVERPLHRRLFSWDAFDGYSLTDDALVLNPTVWWRPKMRSDPEDVKDLDAVVSALEKALTKRAN